MIVSDVWYNCENGVLHDRVNRLHHGVLYIEKSYQYETCINIIPFMPIRKVQPSLHRFSQNSCAGLLYLISSKSETECGKYTQLHIWPKVKYSVNFTSFDVHIFCTAFHPHQLQAEYRVQFSHCQSWFSQNSYSLNNFWQRPRTLIFIMFWQTV